MCKFFQWNFERGKMSAEEEMKQARKWLCENAAAVAKWAVQTTEDLTLSGSFYTKEQLYAALEDSLPLLSPAARACRICPICPKDPSPGA